MHIICILFLYSYYDDFVTIDWVRDRNRDRMRHKRLMVDRELSWMGWGTKVWDALSGWLIVFMVGVSSGLLAGEQWLGRSDTVVLYRLKSFTT